MYSNQNPLFIWRKLYLNVRARVLILWFLCRYTVNQVCASCEFIDEPEEDELVVLPQASHCPVWSVTDNTWAATFRHGPRPRKSSNTASTWSDTNRTSSGAICTLSETSFPPLVLRPPQVHNAHKSKLLRLHHARWCQAHAASAIFNSSALWKKWWKRWLSHSISNTCDKVIRVLPYLSMSITDMMN